MTAGEAVRVPELGPLLGRLVVPAGTANPGAAPWVVLDDIRYQLVTTVLEHAGEAREWGGEAERGLALTPLNRAALLGAWDRAVSGAAQRVVREIDARLAAAAHQSRMPLRRLRDCQVTPIETRAITARLGEGAGPFLQSLDALEVALASLRRGETAPAAFAAWENALHTTARRLEAAWLALEEAVRREETGWAVEWDRVRCWRRPAWPVWSLGGLLFGAATWLGLVIGGYLPVPGFLRPFAEAWWGRF